VFDRFGGLLRFVVPAVLVSFVLAVALWQLRGVQAEAGYLQAANVSAGRTAVVTTALAGAVAIVLSLVFGATVERRNARRLSLLGRAMESAVVADLASLARALRSLADGDLDAGFTSAIAPVTVHRFDGAGAIALGYNAVADALARVADEHARAMKRMREVIVAITGSTAEYVEASVAVSMVSRDAAAALDRIGAATETARGASGGQQERIAKHQQTIDEFFALARSLAHGAQAQVQSVASATTTMRGLDDTMAGVASSGASLAERGRGATSEATVGTEAATRTAQAMIRLRSESESVAGAMRSLEERSAAVGEIVAAIEQIADQTNLLSLNAAIEAARAGEHGRGFAVVAAEIRKLADGSASSAREIGRMLSAIRLDTVAAAGAINATLARVDESVSLADQATTVLASLTETVAETVRTAEALAEQSEAMRAGGTALVEDLANVSRVIDTNLAASKQIESSTEVLSKSMHASMSAATRQGQNVLELSAGTSALAGTIEDLNETARELTSQATEARNVVARFTVERQAVSIGV